MTNKLAVFPRAPLELTTSGAPFVTLVAHASVTEDDAAEFARALPDIIELLSDFSLAMARGCDGDTLAAIAQSADRALGQLPQSLAPTPYVPSGEEGNQLESPAQTLEELDALWDKVQAAELVTVDGEPAISEALHTFPAGTTVRKIYSWFSAQQPTFPIVKFMGGAKNRSRVHQQADAGR